MRKKIDITAAGPFEANEITGWQSRAQEFAQQRSMLDDESIRWLEEHIHPTELKLVILGEKPCLQGTEEIPELPALRNFLGTMKLQTVSSFMYNEELLAALMRRHPDLFSRYKDPAELLSAVSEMPLGDQYGSILEGVAFGYPRNAVEAVIHKPRHTEKLINLYERKIMNCLAQDRNTLFAKLLDENFQDSEALDRLLKDNLEKYASVLGWDANTVQNIKKQWDVESRTFLVDVHGYGWFDMGVSPESRALAGRLAAALEQSGILQMAYR